MNVVLLAAALNSDWLCPGHYHGQAMSQVDQMLLVNNQQDRAMKYYHFSSTSGRPQALGFCGPTCIDAAGASKIIERNVSRYVGKEHDLFCYLSAPGVTSRNFGSYASFARRRDVAASQLSRWLVPLPTPVARGHTGRMETPLAYANGNWIPGSELAVAVDDVGFLLGATITERLRTFRGTGIPPRGAPPPDAAIVGNRRARRAPPSPTNLPASCPNSWPGTAARSRPTTIGRSSPSSRRALPAAAARRSACMAGRSSFTSGRPTTNVVCPSW